MDQLTLSQPLPVSTQKKGSHTKTSPTESPEYSPCLPRKDSDYFKSGEWSKAVLQRKARLATLDTIRPDTITNKDHQTMDVSEYFMKSMVRLKCHSSKKGKEVGMLIRFNRDDASIETFWSENCHFLDKESTQTGYLCPPVTQLASNNGSGGYKINKRQPFMGGHCEEIAVRSWTAFAPTNPDSVDIVLTSSPCLSKSAPFEDSNGQIWPSGCARKLIQLIQSQSKNTCWNIVYFTFYGSSDDKALQAIDELKQLPNVNIFPFDPAPELSP